MLAWHHTEMKGMQDIEEMDEDGKTGNSRSGAQRESELGYLTVPDLLLSPLYVYTCTLGTCAYEAQG